ncbi:hypothetical protein [Nocardia asteroides]|uniref:hypothetical protein n=1 Tax=Nocardia asteroides TaxID=1824 RepID=UPI001E2F2DCB|nr:hypothetical protein [Nocardia asteroides]UGT59133.1 hypothetical protein LTT61_17730 [Nocardia asteroides]
MNATEIVAVIAVIVLVLHNVARIPAALTEILNACKPLVRAARELVALVRNDTTPTEDTRHPGHDRDPPC